MILDILVLAGVVIAQQCVIIGLVNRLLIAKGVSPLRLPGKLWHDSTETPEKLEGKRVKPIMTIPLNP